MSRRRWSVVQGLGLVVVVGFGEAVRRGLFDHDTQLLRGAFDWASGGRDGRMAGWP